MYLTQIDLKWFGLPPFGYGVNYYLGEFLILYYSSLCQDEPGYAVSD
jgi:hypothetical protein